MSARLSKNKSTNKTRSRPRTTSGHKRSSSIKKTLRKSTLSKILTTTVISLISIVFIAGSFWFNRLNKQFVGAQTTGVSTNSYYTLLYGIVDDFNADVPNIASLEFYVFDTNGKKVSSYKLDGNYELDLGIKYGKVPVSKLYSLGLLQGNQSKNEAFEFIDETIFNLFAFNVDRFVYADVSEKNAWDSILKHGNYLPLFSNLVLDGTSKNYSTNMHLDEIYQTATFVNSLPEDRLTTLEITAADFLTIDENLRELTLDSQFALDAKNIAVLNGGETSGVASFGSRVVKNLGGRVVSVVNSDEQFGESFIVSDNFEDLSTKVLSEAFHIAKVLTKAQAQTILNTNDLYRADILLVLVK